MAIEERGWMQSNGIGFEIGRGVLCQSAIYAPLMIWIFSDLFPTDAQHFV